MTGLKLLLYVLFSAGFWTVTFNMAVGGIAERREIGSARTRARTRVALPSELERRANELRARYEQRGFTVLTEAPFVVLGDEDAATVRSHATYTVRWAVDRLKKDFFKIEPTEILEIWLFKDAESYRRHAKELFGDDPDTPFGYYSPKHKALIMNIATGGGTLVHEIVHPFIRAIHPTCPAWLNEGLASLFEESKEVDDRIVGCVNWRLKGLKRAIRRKDLPTFEKLFSLSNEGFYSSAKGDNYAQSRYLLYYLQEKRLLHGFWASAVANRKTDPTGLATLKETLHRDDLDQFQRDWEKWVLELTP